MGLGADSTARRFLVAGAVQGVGYRAFVRRAALRLGLVGHAENLIDGRVEVVAVGSVASVTELAGVIRRGPPFSRVDDVAESDWPVPPGISGFQIK